MGLTLQARVKKIFHGVQTNWPFGKEKVPGTVVSKEGHAERTHYNSISYCQLLRENSSYLLNDQHISIKKTFTLNNEKIPV